MKKLITIFTFIATIIVSFIIFPSCNNQEKKDAPQTLVVTHEQQVERGRYLVLIGGCGDCHTPKKFTAKGPVFNEDLTLAGFPQDEKLPEIDPSEITPGKWYLATSGLNGWVGPWGVSFAANLTPDTLTGSGAWTEELFLKILRSGKFMGLDAGRPIMPPMPWEAFGKMTDDDLKSIFAYIKSLKPIRNVVPAYIPPNEISAVKNKI